MRKFELWKKSALVAVLFAAAGCVSPPPQRPPETPPPAAVPEVPPQTPVVRPPEKTPETQDILTIGEQLRIFEKTGDAAQARQAVENQVGLARLTATDKSAYAGLLMAEGKFDQARRTFQEVLDKKPEDKESLLALAFLAGSEGKSDLQKTYLDRLLTARPQDPDVLAAAGLFYYTQGKTSQAEDFYNRSLAAKDNADAREGLARLALDAEKWDQALNQTDAGLLLEPRRDSLHSLRSRAHAGLGKFLEAEVDLTRAVGFGPTNPWNYLDRARLRWRELYKPDGALEDLAKVLDKDPQNFFALVYRGEINESRDKVPEAYQDYLKILELRPDYKFAYPSMAILAFQQKDWRRAEEYARKAWVLYPGEYAFPWISALSLRALGKNQDSKPVLDQAFRQYAAQPLIQEMCRFLLTPQVSFGLDDGLAKERSPVVRTRLKFYQGFQYFITGKPRAAAALWDEVAAQTLRNVPEIRMAKAFLPEIKE